MHDLDRTTMEMENMNDEIFELGSEAQSPFSEAEAMELAAELLSVSNEGELNYFLGNLVKKAWGGIKKAAASPIGQQIISGLKGVAKQALPSIGKAIGDYVAPGTGGAIGSQLATKAGSMLGLELEGLSHEDQEFEVAKQLVHLAGAAAHHAASAPSGAPPHAIAKAAITEAAKTYAPGLVGKSGAIEGGRHQGRWYRKGNKIVLLGV